MEARIGRDYEGRGDSKTESCILRSGSGPGPEGDALQMNSMAAFANRVSEIEALGALEDIRTRGAVFLGRMGPHRDLARTDVLR